MSDDELPPPPPGKVVLTATFEGWSITFAATLSSPGYADRAVLVCVRPHRDHLDLFAYDNATHQRIEDVEPLRPYVEAHLATTVAQLIDITTDDQFHLEGEPRMRQAPIFVPLDPEPGRKAVH